MKIIRIEHKTKYLEIDDEVRRFFLEFCEKRSKLDLTCSDGITKRKLIGARVSTVTLEKGGEYLQLISEQKEFLVRLDSIIRIDDKNVSELREKE